VNRKINAFAVLIVAVLCTILLVVSFAKQMMVPEPKVIEGKVTEISYTKIALIDDKGEEQSFYLSEDTRVYIIIPKGSGELKQNLYLSISGKVVDKSIEAKMIGIWSEVNKETIEDMLYETGAEALEKFAGGKICQVKSIAPLEIEDLNEEKFSVKVTTKTEIYEILTGEIIDVKKDDRVNLRIFDLSEMGIGNFFMISVLKEK